MKVWNYMMIMLTMMVFLAFIGVPITGGNAILTSVGINVTSTTGDLESGDVANSEWYNDLFNATDGLIVVAGLGVAIIVGLFTRQFDWKLVLVGFFTSFAIKFVAVGWSVVQLAQATNERWLIAVVATIFLPLAAMFIFSIVEWFGGGGTGG